MMRRGLRRFALHAVLPVTMVLLGMNVNGQEWSTGDVEPLVVGCTHRPSPAASKVSLAVDKAWVDEHASLRADLLVTNGSEAAIQLPRANVCRRYWSSHVDPIPRGEEEWPTLWCSGSMERPPNECDILGWYDDDPLETLLAEEDIETIAPGRTALLRAVYLGQFVPEMQERQHAVRSFEVIYHGLSAIDVSILPKQLARHKTRLAEASARQCHLYNVVLRSRGQFLTPKERVPVPGEVITIVVPSGR